MEWLIVPLLGFAGAALGVIGKGLYDVKFKKIDDAAKIRAELWEQLANLRKIADQLREKYENTRSLATDLDIACSRCVSRLDECVEVIERLLRAEESLDIGDVARARTVLKLVERDRQMREQMTEDERKRSGGLPKSGSESSVD